MNERTKILKGSYKAKQAIIIYEGDQREYYLESHTINEAGNILAGKPLQQETINEMVDVFFDERKASAEVKGLIPANLLSFSVLPGGNYKMVWYRPEEIRVVQHVKALKIPTNNCWVPATLYAVERNQLDVFALNSNNRPEEKTQIYLPPFFNVSNTGDVCLGDANVKKPTEKTYINLMKYWEDLFWLSEFTHENGDKKIKSNDLATVWRKLMASKTKLKWSGLDELLAAKNTKLSNLL